MTDHVERNLAALADAITKRGNIGPRITRGRTVMVYGPWSNGHMEQCAVVTNVAGEGVAPGSLCNLFVYVDMGQPIIAENVPWFATWAEAEQALAAREEKTPIAGAQVCYFPNRE